MQHVGNGEEIDDYEVIFRHTFTSEHLKKNQEGQVLEIRPSAFTLRPKEEGKLSHDWQRKNPPKIVAQLISSTPRFDEEGYKSHEDYTLIILIPQIYRTISEDFERSIYDPVLEPDNGYPINKGHCSCIFDTNTLSPDSPKKYISKFRRKLSRAFNNYIKNNKIDLNEILIDLSNINLK